MRNVLFFLAIALAWAPAAVAGRILPSDAKVGILTPAPYPFVDIDQVPVRMAPGAVIFDAFNRSILPVSLPPQAKVFYRLDAQGQLQKAWIMTPAEEAASSATP